MLNALAMILAGGRGTRMDILCHERPKPALPFAGRFHVIDFSLSNCIHSQIHNIALLVDYQRAGMTDYLRRWSSINASDRALHVLEPKYGSYQGTADAVYQNLGYLHGCGVDKTLVLAGDHVYKMDYRQMLAFHDQVKADVTVGVVRVPIEQAYRFGTVITDTEGRIVDFMEKTSVPRTNLASMGIYAFNNDVLAERLAEDAAQPDSPHDFGYSVIPRMVRKDRVYTFNFDGYWQDIGTIEAYYAANMELVRERPSFSLDGTWPVFTDDHNPLPPGIPRQGGVRNSLLSPGCVVKGRVENSILSPGVRVEAEAVVTNSVLMANVSVGYHSVVDHCVLDEGVSVGKFCYVGFRTGQTSGDPDITVLGKGAAIPHHVAIGHRCRILPHVGHSDFSTSMVPSGGHISPRPATITEETVAVS
jgi:glucose-1-phosphate adenylyltransferase